VLEPGRSHDRRRDSGLVHEPRERDLRRRDAPLRRDLRDARSPERPGAAGTATAGWREAPPKVQRGRNALCEVVEQVIK
jgi:hypothetical protein